MNSDNKIKKLLLMGRQGAGKTSMHSIIFANYPPKETMGIGFTVDVNECKFKFMGNLTLNLWDCGGQDKLMEHYFTIQRDTIFKNVEVLIYVFDVESEGKKLEHDIEDYQNCLKNLVLFSKNVNVFILIHKMDKIKESERSKVYEQKKQQIENISKVQGLSIKEAFGTSIWDETLYKAWSSIVQLLIPNMQFVKSSLKQFCTICDCDEIVLFERSTFLIIAYHENKQDKDILKYERLSNIVKQFKLSCNKIQAQIKSVAVRNSLFTAFIEEFTQNTFIMVVFSDPKIQPASIELNIQLARQFFEKNSKNEMDNLLYQWEKNKNY